MEAINSMWKERTQCDRSGSRLDEVESWLNKMLPMIRIWKICY